MARVNWLARLILVVSASVLSAANGNAQSHPSPEKHQTSATVSAHGTNHNNQSALYAALIEALHAVTHQEEAAAIQTRAENKSLLTPLGVQKGLLVVGLVYSVLALFQWREIRRQAKIANEALFRQFRPRLKIRNIVIDVANEIPQPPLFRERYPISGHFYISNTGGTAAKISEIGVWVEWNQNLPMERPYEGKHGVVCSATVLEASQSIQWAFNSADDNKLMDSVAAKILAAEHGWALYIMGWVEYVDGLNTTRRTAFCRKYDVSKRRFFAVDDNDYEHTE